MQVSAELRWFWTHGVPPALGDWFRGLGDGAAPGGGAPRLDEYVLDRTQRQLGIKTRGGKSGVEVKGLVQISAEEAVAPFARRPQIWCKWTSDVLTIGHLQRTTVRKVRLLRKFDADSELLREIALDEHERPRDAAVILPTHGCHIELVSLGIEGSTTTWWTLAFEAFGPMDTVEETLHRTLAHVLRESTPQLGDAQSLSYPEWLAREAL